MSEDDSGPCSEIVTKIEWSFGKKYCVAFAASAVAETVTYPLDLTKTRMQIFGEMEEKSGKATHKGKNAGMIRTAAGVIKEEGFFKLWHGLSPAIYRHMIYSGLRMGLYEKIREDIFGRNADGTYPVYKAAMGGFLAGGIAQFTASPLDLVKVQLQTEGRRRLEGKPVRVKNVFQALTSIYRESGIRGLWKGWVPNVQRGALVNLGDLTTYDTAKRFFLKKTTLEDNIFVHIMSSFCAGLTSTIMGTPADLVKTRYMNQPTVNGVGVYYKSSIDCLQKTVQREGFFALYKGFFPIWFRLGPWSLTFWITFEWLRKTLGGKSF